MIHRGRTEEGFVKIGHVNLAGSFNGTGGHFIALIEALDRHGIKQHVIVCNNALAKRVAIYDNVTLGPVTASPVVAYCLMPKVDVVHVHNDKSAQSGLLLTLTKSIPFVLTRRDGGMSSTGPISRSIEDRAAGLICCTKEVADTVLRRTSKPQVVVIEDIAMEHGANLETLGNRAAADHLRVYRRAIDAWRMPALML
jgi:hypothetical protein